MENFEVKKIKIEVEIPQVIYMALLENKMLDTEDVYAKARQAVIDSFSSMYKNQAIIPMPLRRYLEANYGVPPHVHSKARNKRNAAKDESVETETEPEQETTSPAETPAAETSPAEGNNSSGNYGGW